MKRTIILLLFCLSAFKGFSQIDTNGVFFTPDHLLDTVYTKDGRKLLLRDLQINPEPGIPNRSPAITTSCSAGYFNLYYATNSGMSSLTNTVEIEKRNVLCKVFTDISNLINSPISAGTNTNNYRVNILIEDPAPILAVAPFFGASATSIYAVVP